MPKKKERTTDEPLTLQEAIRYFADPDKALAYFVARRWPDGVVCPICGSEAVIFLKNQRRWKCSQDHERRQFSVKVGTIMEDSPMPLDKWLTAMWMASNCKNGVSSYEIARALDITQKSAWFMLQRIRLAMHDEPNGPMTGGHVEADETFIGGLARNMHKHKRVQKIKGTGGAGKAIVMGLLDRHDREKGHSVVRATPVPNRKADTLGDAIKANVVPGSQIHTDEWVGYNEVDSEYAHNVVNHAEQYVDGLVHTNGIENFWSLLKRCIRGTYVSVEPFHLFRYVDEQAFRFNERKNDLGDYGRLGKVAKGIAGKRLTYKQLIGEPTEPSAAAPA